LTGDDSKYSVVGEYFDSKDELRGWYSNSTWNSWALSESQQSSTAKCWLESRIS